MLYYKCWFWHVSFVVHWLRPLVEVRSHSVGAVQNPQAAIFFLFIIILPFVTFFPILLSLLSLNFYQTVRHSPGERSRDIPPDNPRSYFVAWWAHLRVIRMRMGEWCFASEFPYRGHPIVWRLVWKSIGSWSMQTYWPRRNIALAMLGPCVASGNATATGLDREWENNHLLSQYDDRRACCRSRLRGRTM